MGLLAGGPGGGAGAGAAHAAAAGQPVEFNHAIEYVNKIKVNRPMATIDN